ncbi:hypothetical protein [Bradyrhizobium sp. YR681]|uniref:hypothetical protein n=1 Tax=Bradyrhizobium sp. YR681 TaxID=1144344 RepID=UPI0012F6BDB7|nr:hypothetical protein [Bradyrhizobium sp. YR681]
MADGIVRIHAGYSITPTLQFDDGDLLRRQREHRASGYEDTKRTLKCENNPMHSRGRVQHQQLTFYRIMT